MLDKIAEILIERGLVGTTWAQEMTTRGELVKLFRDYYDGMHRAELTTQMRKMLRVKNNTLDRFNINYCPLVVDSMADRLTVEGIEAVEKKANRPHPPNPSPRTGEGNDNPLDVQQSPLNPSVAQREADTEQNVPSSSQSVVDTWAERVLTRNRFDALQIDVREATLRDGDTFVMVEYSDEEKLPKFAHELAWDGESGVMVVYDRMGKSIVAGVKVWLETEKTRVNIYFQKEMMRFEAGEGGDLTALSEMPEDTSRDGKIVGVPIIHFKNKGTKTRGVSELINVIPLQDGLNRTFVSMVMTAELSAFQIRTAKGFTPPSDLAPGSWVKFGDDIDEADLLGAMEAGTMEQAELVPFIEEADFIVNQIGIVTHTPLPASSDTQSGEALKQREIGLLGKVSRSKVQLGNSYEDMMEMAHLQARVFGRENLPDVESWNTRWKDSQIRNDADLVQIADWFMRNGYEREALRIMAQSSALDYKDADIERMITEKAKDSQRKLLMMQLPGMSRFDGVDEDKEALTPNPSPSGRGEQAQPEDKQDEMVAAR